jgi:outer membrane receptor protein involved in Fe transport
MKRVLFTAVSIFFTFFALFSEAQQPQGQRMQGGNGGRMSMEGGFGTIKGTIIDETTNSPVEYANIIIYKQRDSSLVTGGITDTKGNFSIDKVPFGRYFVDFKFIGYKNYRLTGIIVSPRQPELTLETVKLKSTSESMEGIVVSGQKSMLQNNLDKLVINVDRSINVEGGTALDIMRNIPAVEVDVEGNVSVRGSSNLTILIDGRPSQITSLEELPANLVQSVELITNPSVRYDPDGLSGILNIVLIKKRTPGYHGMVSVNAGTGNKYSGTVNLNIRKGKFNYFANFDYRYFSTNGSGITERETMRNDTTYFLNQNSKDNRGGLSNNLRAGFDYFINSKNTLSFSTSGSIRKSTGDENLNSITFNEFFLPKDSSNSRTKSEDNSRGISSDYAINYKKTFDTPGKEFTTDVFFSNSHRSSDENLILMNNFTSASSYEKSVNDGLNYTLTFQSDFVTPIGNGGRLETGAKGIIRNQDADLVFQRRDLVTNPWVKDVNVSNHFVLKDQVYAGYAIYSNTIGPISYQGGIRVEEQFKKADQRTTDSVVNVSFFNIFPSAHIKWDINKVNAVQISYSRRVNRPSSRDLNPFIDREDTLNISYGNPWLEPEFTDAYEIGHTLALSTTNLSSTLFYRYRTNLIARYSESVDKYKSVSYPLNLNGGSTLGVEFILSQKINSWWRVNGSYSYYKAKIDDKSVNKSASESYSWNTKLSSSMSIGKNLELQLNGNYRSPVITGIGGGGGHGPMGGGGGSQGKTKEMYSLDLGVRYMVMNKKGTITLRVSDVFNTRNFITNSWADNQKTYSENFHESRIVFIGFSYRINDYKQRRDTKMEDMNMDTEN